MVSSIDVCIVAAYLVFMLAIGFYTAKIPIRNLRDYALGTSPMYQYSMLVLAGTVLATDFGAGSTLGDASKIFKFGIGFVLFKFTVIPFYLTMGEIVAPRMRYFIEKNNSTEEALFISAGDVMGHFYSEGAKVFTGLMSLIRSVGVLGAQVSAMGWLFHHVFGWHYGVGVLLGLGIVVAYTTAGGIRSVVTTDIWQLGIIILVIPFITNLALSRFLGTQGFVLFNLHSWQLLWKQLPQTHKSLVPIGMQPIQYVALLIVGVSAFLEPNYIQRFLMAKRTQDITHVFRLTTLIMIPLCSMVMCAGFAACLIFPEADPTSVLPRVLSLEAHSGFFGFCLVAILAAIMSTADSHLNVASVSFSHDVCKTLLGSRLSEKAELRLARLSTLGVGLLSGLAAVYCKDIRDLLIASLDAWGPTVTIPLWAGLLGYRASARTFMIAVLAGQVVYWGFPHCLPLGYKLSATLPAMLANAAAFTLARRWDRPAACPSAGDRPS